MEGRGEGYQKNDMANEVIIELIARTEAAQGKIDALESEIKGMKQATEKATGATAQLTQKLDQMTGGAISGFKGMVGGIKNGIKSLKTFKAALAATGIGALVIAVGSLATAFTRTQKGAETFDRITATLGATIDVVLDRVSNLGLAIAAFFSGEFKKAGELAKGIFGGISEEIEKEAQTARDLADAQNELEKQEAELVLTSAKRLAQIEDLKLKAEDTTKSERERLAALREAIALEKEEADQRIAIAAERARIIKIQNEQGESRTEDVRRQREAEAELFNAQRERDSRLKELTAKLNTLTAAEQKQTEVVKEEVKVNQDLINAEKARLDMKASQIEQIAALEDAYFQSQLDKQTQEENAVLDKYFTQIEAAKQYGQDTAILEEAREAELAGIRDKYRKEDENKEKAMTDAKIGLAQTGLNVIGEIFGQQSVAGKAAAIASATIDTYKAFTNALANTPLPPPGPQIAAGLTLASGFAQVRNILSTPIPNGFGGGGGASAGRGGAPTPTLPNVSILGGNEAMTQATRSLAQFGKKPTRAYVVSGEMTDNQALDRRIERNASFG
jgi:hypothetical protein